MEWIKFTEQLPPYNGTEILIAMRNKNMEDDGIWLYDVCYYVGGDITDNDNNEVNVLTSRDTKIIDLFDGKYNLIFSND